MNGKLEQFHFHYRRWLEGEKKRAKDEWAMFASHIGFDIWAGYSFFQDRITQKKGEDFSLTREKRAVKLFKKFQKRRAEKTKSHILSLWAMGKQRKRKPKKGIEGPEVDGRWHIHSNELYEKRNGIIRLVKDIQNDWKHGLNHIEPYDPSKGGLPYTEEGHSEGNIFLFSCPRQAGTCRRGNCYFEQEQKERLGRFR